MVPLPSLLRSQGYSRPLACIQRPGDWSESSKLLVGNLAPGQRV